jgi:alpha-glucosidase (family GH31 glycosyl hydrolase)
LAFGEPGDPMYEALVKFLHLRYRLLPYIYSLAAWTTHHDYTILRLLAFDFRDDPAVYAIRDQFMFGPAFLVCPVTQPMLYTAGSTPVADAAKSRRVYLPTGCDWWDFWTDARLSGGQRIVAAADLATIPLYVRAGSIVPIAPPMQYVDEQPDAVIELHIFLAATGAFSCMKTPATAMITNAAPSPPSTSPGRRRRSGWCWANATAPSLGWWRSASCVWCGMAPGQRSKPASKTAATSTTRASRLEINL